MFPMFNVNELYELLKTNDFEDVRAAFDLALDEANERRKQETYKFGTHELPDEWFARIDTNETTMEDVVLLMYTVLYRDYPEMRPAMENVDIAKETKELMKVIDLILHPENVADVIGKLFDNTQTNIPETGSKSKTDKDVINNFLKFFY